MSDFLIRYFALQGFRAYLKPRRFDLVRNGTALSLALFAENGHGKSGLADGIGFYLSSNGTLDHLGAVANTSQGGPAALQHVDAASTGVGTSVTIGFDLAGISYNEPRTIGEAPPAAVDTVRPLIPVDPIIRGRQLRQFVEQSEGDRYKEIASWFGLQPLIDLQEDLSKLRRAYKVSSSDTTVCEAAVADLSKLTDSAITHWDEPVVLKWVNETLIYPLKDALSLSRLSVADEGYQCLSKLKAAEDLRLGLPRLWELKKAAEDVAGQSADGESGGRQGGKAVKLQAAQARLEAAIRAVDAARATSAKALQAPVWNQAVELLEKDAYVDDACPVCATPFDATEAGSRTALVENLKRQMASLDGFNKASTEETIARTDVTTATNGLRTALTVLQNQFETAGRPLPANLVKMVAVSTFTAEDLTKVIAEAAAAADALDAEIVERQAAQGLGSCKDSLEKLNKIIDMTEARRRAEAEMDERKAILKTVDEAAKEINDDIQDYVSGVLDVLREEVNDLYTHIVRFPNGAAPPNVNLALPESGRRVNRMHLTIDFAENCTSVAPGGYLSDAQLHSLGLALRLCAIRRFNTGAPFIVLDDVVTSYDRDHRQLIANMLATDFQDFQIIVVTHERQFFEYLRKELPPKRWVVKRISEIKLGEGPVLADDRPSDEEIEELLKRGVSAENEIRKAQEVWLQRICFEFGVSVIMPNPTDLPRYGRAELAQALESFVKDRKINLDMSYFTVLKTGAAENTGSHGNLDASAGPSGGDMEVRWQGFKDFRAQFTCGCGRGAFQRSPSMRYPRCKQSSCEEPFKGIPAIAGGAA